MLYILFVIIIVVVVVIIITIIKNKSSEIFGSQAQSRGGQHAACEQFLCCPPDLQKKKSTEALSYRPITSACQSIIRPFLVQILPLNDPILYYSPRPKTLFFQNWNVKFQIFLSARKFCQFPAKNSKFLIKFDQFTPNDPLFFLNAQSFSSHTK